MRNIYIRADGKFPIYEPQKNREHWADYSLVHDVSEPIDFDTHMYGKYETPYESGGKWYVKRQVVIRNFDAADEMAMQAMRNKRNAMLVDTDIELLKLLENQFPELKKKRQDLRDITDPSKNGGKTKPSDMLEALSQL